MHMCVYSSRANGRDGRTGRGWTGPDRTREYRRVRSLPPWAAATTVGGVAIINTHNATKSGYHHTHLVPCASLRRGYDTVHSLLRERLLAQAMRRVDPADKHQSVVGESPPAFQDRPVVARNFAACCPTIPPRLPEARFSPKNFKTSLQ